MRLHYFYNTQFFFLSSTSDSPARCTITDGFIYDKANKADSKNHMGRDSSLIDTGMEFGDTNGSVDIPRYSLLPGLK